MLLTSTEQSPDCLGALQFLDALQLQLRNRAPARSVRRDNYNVDIYNYRSCLTIVFSDRHLRMHHARARIYTPAPWVIIKIKFS